MRKTWKCLPTKRQYVERNKIIYAKQQKGETLRAIGKSYDLSSSRIYQICEREWRRGQEALGLSKIRHRA